MHIHCRQRRQRFARADTIIAGDHAHPLRDSYCLFLKSAYRAAGKGIDQHQHAVNVGMRL
nr:hypothetical protein [Salmonella enterica]